MKTNCSAKEQLITS